MLPPRFGTNCPMTGVKNGDAQHGLRSFIYSARGPAPGASGTGGPGSWGCGILCEPVQGVAGPAPGMREKGSKRKGTRPARSEFRLPFPAPAGPGPPFPAHLGPGVTREPNSRPRAKDFGLHSWHLGADAAPNGPRIGEKTIVNNLGNEREFGGTVTATWPGGGTRAGPACWKRQSLRPGWPGRPRPALETTARSPRGPDLGSWGCSVGCVPDFSRPPRPQTSRACSQGLLRKALEVRGERNPGWNPEAGGKARFRCPLPSRPLGGKLTLAEGRALACSLPGRPSSSLGAAGGVYAVRFATAPSAFPAVRKSSSASATGRLEVMPIGETKNNANPCYKTK